ncbi:recombinase family protein [Rhizobium rhizogenes]|uniref:recombinase family protein n=1 Tax=Rhizobium rhizogenes TaxID=359 RepID=UPI0022CBC093|nr:recombinase family protein [Rhizobium rhizogenes]MCZ7463979.1 recombinase family protein [Rhizobium rhizogenes]
MNNSKSKTLGYARVSTDEQKLDLQLHALREAGCNRLFVDKGISGGESDRPGLTKALTSLRPGDTLVVWRLDRLGRSLINLIQLIETLGRHGINFRSLNENIDATSSGGRLIFHMMAALCEFERTLISERTKAGMDAARRRGRRLGRPPELRGERLKAAVSAVREKGEPLQEVAARFNVSTRTLKRAMQAERTGLSG